MLRHGRKALTHPCLGTAASLHSSLSFRSAPPCPKRVTFPASRFSGMRYRHLSLPFITRPTIEVTASIFRYAFESSFIMSFFPLAVTKHLAKSIQSWLSILRTLKLVDAFLFFQKGFTGSWTRGKQRKYLTGCLDLLVLNVLFNSCLVQLLCFGPFISRSFEGGQSGEIY